MNRKIEMDIYRKRGTYRESKKEPFKNLKNHYLSPYFTNYQQKIVKTIIQGFRPKIVLYNQIFFRKLYNCLKEVQNKDTYFHYKRENKNKIIQTFHWESAPLGQIPPPRMGFKWGGGSVVLH